MLVSIFDDRAQRGSTGDAVFQAGEEHRRVGLPPGGGKGALPRLPPGQEGVQLLQVDGLPGGQAVHRHPDGLRVGLTEDGDVDVFTEV